LELRRDGRELDEHGEVIPGGLVPEPSAQQPEPGRRLAFVIPSTEAIHEEIDVELHAMVTYPET
jgi:hypothetical protein